MTVTVLPDIDYSKLEELRKRLPDLSDIDLSAPKLEDIGKRAEETVDRLLGRRRAPMWPRILAAIGLIALVGVIAVWLTWARRPGWDAGAEDELEPTGMDRAGSNTSGAYGGGTFAGSTAGARVDTATDVGGGTSLDGETAEPAATAATSATWDERPAASGLTAAEASLVSSRDADERG